MTVHLMLPLGTSWLRLHLCGLRPDCGRTGPLAGLLADWWSETDPFHGQRRVLHSLWQRKVSRDGGTSLACVAPPAGNPKNRTSNSKTFPAAILSGCGYIRRNNMWLTGGRRRWKPCQAVVAAGSRLADPSRGTLGAVRGVSVGRLE